MAPQPDGDELYGRHEVIWSFIISCCDASELLDLVEEPFDEVALSVDPGREDKGSRAVGFGWNIGPSLPLGGFGADSVAVIALVGQQNGTLTEIFHQGIGLGTVGHLPGGQAEMDGAAFGIDECVDFTGKPPTGTSHAAIVSSPFFPVAACWCTRTQVLSIITISPS